MTENICLSIDVMSGDFGPRVTIPAVIKAYELFQDTAFILVGDEQLIKGMLPDSLLANPRMSILHTTQVVDMDESPALAMKKKKDSSMRVSIEQVKSGKASASVSAGNTGALMAISRYVLGMCHGLDRPAIIHPMPSRRIGSGKVYMLDLGANVECSSGHLYQFARMGDAFARHVGQLSSPSVGLLNIGSEENKGTETIKQAHAAIKSNSGLNYYGYVEGYDIYRGTVDVVVCDGFVGNVALKTSEGLAEFVLKEFKQILTSNMFYKVCGLFALPVLKALANKLDPNNYNGAALLGLNGVVIKSHGGAKTKSFLQAITSARLAAKHDVVEKVQNILSSEIVGE